MMKVWKFAAGAILSAILMALFGTLQAQETQQQPVTNVNSDLQFNDKPLEPVAVGRMTVNDASRKEPIDLNQHTPEMQDLIIQDRLDKPKENKIGYSFKYKAYTLETQNPSYVIYKVIGDLGNHQYLMLIESGGGGTGEFSSLLIMERNGNVIQNVKDIAGGDRANGGIVDASYKDGMVTVVQYVTPFSAFSDALALTDPKNPILQYNNPDNNLIEAANCRAGEITSTSKVGEKLTPISLTFYAATPCGSNAKPGTLQDFYEQAVNTYRQQGKTTLNAQEMSDFAKTVIEKFKNKPS